MGVLAVFSVIFSGIVISYDQEYGPIGVVFGLMAFFIAVGVVIILGLATKVIVGAVKRGRHGRTP